MVSRSVNWGGGGPNISGAMDSLGASLAGAVTGGPANNRAARDAAYMESLQHHNQVYDNQAAAIAAKQAADQAKADRDAADYAAQQEASKTLGDAAAMRIGPAPVAVYGPEQVPGTFQRQHDQWDADVKATRAGAPYVLAGGGNADSRAKGFKEFYNPGPVPVDTKPLFDSQHTRRLVPDAQDPSGYRSVPIGGAPAPSSTQKPTAENLKAAGFVKRLEDANRIMNEPKVAESSQSLSDRALDYLPLAGRYFQSPDYKRRADAETDMVTAVLRDESGATISDPEFGRDADKYFPRPNDPPEVVADKARRRQIQIDAMKLKAGPVLQQGDPAAASGNVSFDETNPRHKQLVEEAQQAIAEGRDEAMVMKRLNEMLANEGSQ